MLKCTECNDEQPDAELQGAGVDPGAQCRDIVCPGWYLPAELVEQLFA